MATVRITICGDESVGKSSLLNALVRETFTPNVQHVLPPITLPPSATTPSLSPGGIVSTTVVDTSALPQERDRLKKEVRKCNVILLVYSDHYSYERISLYWMPLFRTWGVNVPVILCANKSDLAGTGSMARIIKDELAPVMAEFKEIDSCIRTSARDFHNVNEVFFLCQKAITYPVGPVYDSKETDLKPAAKAALRRVFYLCDRDQDGVWNDDEIRGFQAKCFDKSLSEEDLTSIKHIIHHRRDHGDTAREGIDLEGFLRLNRIFAEKGRHETIWMILRKFHYTDSLSLKESFIHPPFDVPAFASAELTPAGYRFFLDLFFDHDKDNDGGLNDVELAALFAPTPGIPTAWVDAGFPSCTVRNEAGYITLQGWLAQWSMTTFESPHTTLAYLAHLGFESADGKGTTSALQVTKPRKQRNRAGRVERSVFLCYVLGAPSSGKSALLDAFLDRPFDTTYHPTIKPRTAVNSVEIRGGKQCYLILSELGELEPAILENPARLAACDLICYTYDSGDPDSFQHILDLQRTHPGLTSLPSVFAALKADVDRTVQRADLQPDAVCDDLRMPQPMHISVRWSGVPEFIAYLAECARTPSQALPRAAEGEGREGANERAALWLAVGAVMAVGVGFAWVWRKNHWVGS